MDIKFELRHKNAVLPTYAHPGDAGMDLVAAEMIKDNDDGQWFDTHVGVEIPDGYVGLVFPRSSISKKDLMLANGVGIIDSGYRGNIQVRFNTLYIGEIYNYSVGDRVAQLIIIPYPQINPIEVESLSDSTRGVDGFGSTGR